MKILLTALNAKYIHSNPAIFSLKSYAEEHGISVDIMEFSINQSPDLILQEIYEQHPDFIGFSCYIWNISMMRILVQEYHKLDPLTALWLGGPEVSHAPVEVMNELPELTGIMYGEGEISFFNVLNAYLSSSEHKSVTNASERPFYDTDCIPVLSGVKGIVYRNPQNGQIITNDPQPLTDFSALPFLYKQEMDLHSFTNRIVYYESARGCPFQCSYCLSSIDKTTRVRDTARVTKELQHFLDLHVPQVKFIDRTFNFNRSRAMEIWHYLIEHDNQVTNFHFEIKGDLLDDEQLALLRQARPGLFQFEIGVQTTNPDTIKAIRRATDLKKLQHVVSVLRKDYRIHLHLDLIAGLPYEDLASFATSFHEVYLMQPHQLQLGFLKVLQGSLMHEQAKEFGIISKSYPPYEVMKTAWLSYDDVIHLKLIEEMVEVYFNSGQFTYSLQYLEHFFATSYDMFKELAAFYKRNGVHQLQHARIKRYELLLECMECYSNECEVEESLFSGFSLPLFKELLTLDAYLRENMKSRPKFSGPVVFYERDKSSRIKETQQTHSEQFSFMLLESAKTGIAIPETRTYLFDYRSRSPMTNNAAFTIL